MSMSKLFELGPLAIAMLVLLVLAVTGYEAVKKFYRQSEGGERRKLPMVIECPNKQAMIEIMKQSRLQQTTNTETLRVVERVAAGIEHLEEKHGDYTSDGVAAALGRVESIGVGVDRLLEDVKPGSRSQKVSEEVRDMIKELVADAKVSHGLMHELVSAMKMRNGKG